MKYLLDTHGLIWWWQNDPRLSDRARETLVDRTNDILVSSATAWEIATKCRAGRLPGVEPYVRDYATVIAAAGFLHLDVRPDHGVRGGLLDGAHRDPFDRLIAAQALIDDLIVITRDPQIAAFGCKVLW